MPSPNLTLISEWFEDLPVPPLPVPNQAAYEAEFIGERPAFLARIALIQFLLHDLRTCYTWSEITRALFTEPSNDPDR